MARYDTEDYAHGLERIIKRERNSNNARKILYDEMSFERFSNASFDELIDQAEYLFTNLLRTSSSDLTEKELFDQAMESIIEYHVAMIASDDEDIWHESTNKERDWIDQTLKDFGPVMEKMRGSSRRGRDERDDDRDYRSRDRKRDRDRGRDNGRDRKSSSNRDNYFKRREQRGYSGREVSRGENIGQRQGDFNRYQRIKSDQEQGHESNEAPSNVIHYDRPPRNFSNQRTVEPPKVEEPVVISKSQLDSGFRYTPNLGQVAHFLYDIRTVVPTYDIVGNGDEAGTLIGERFLNINSERGRQIMAESGHSGYLFTNRRGPRTDDSDPQSNSITKVYRRLLQQPEKIEDIFDQLEITETAITAKPNAALPVTFNRVPLVVEGRINTSQYMTHNFPNIILNHVEKHVQPLDSSFSAENSILIATVITTAPFDLMILDEDTIAVKSALRSLESRNSVSAIATFMNTLADFISLRDWNYVNDQLTEVANSVANIEFGIPVKIKSFTTDIKSYVENIEERYGRKVAEQFSERSQFMVKAGLATVESEETISFAYNTKVILLPVESNDLTIGLANADQATGIVSQANFPDLHDGLMKIIESTDSDIAKILIILRDGTQLSVHFSPIGKTILLHRKD